jgi:septal ring factor EnvC (AmiA/AmiB activator)
MNGTSDQEREKLELKIEQLQAYVNKLTKELERRQAENDNLHRRIRELQHRYEP